MRGWWTKRFEMDTTDSTSLLLGSRDVKPVVIVNHATANGALKVSHYRGQKESKSRLAIRNFVLPDLAKI